MITIFLLLASLLPQEPKIVTCVFREADNTANCIQTVSKRKITGVIFKLEGMDLAKWRLTAPIQDGGVNSDAPLFEVPLKDRQEVKAIIDGERLIPIESCSVRVWRKLKNYILNHPGERVPFGLRTEPDDCQLWYEKN